MLVRYVYLLILSLIISACSGVGGSMDSSRLAGASVILSLNSTNVSWDGTNLIGSISVKATDYTGAAVSGYTPTASVTSSTSVTARILASVSSFSPFKNTNRSVTYNILPCTATDASGISTCQVQVSAGTGTLTLDIAGTGASTPLAVDLSFYAPPTITGVSPTIVDPGSTTTLTLTGTGFRSPMTVTVGSLTCATVNVTSTTSATCSLTTTAALGLMAVTVTTADSQFDTLSSGINVKDRAAPIILISTQPPSLSNQATTTIGFSVTDNDATIANLTITCTLDSSPTTCAPPTLLLSSLSDGIHNLTISAVDPSGNASTQSVNWTVDTIAPTLTFDNSGLGSSPSSSTTTRSVTVGGADVVTYKAVVIRSGACSSADFSAATETAVGTAFSMPITTDGNYTICGIGKDAAGNWQTVASSTASSTLAIDTSIPYIVSIAGNLTSPSNDSSARSLTMSGTDVAAYKAVTLKNVSDCSTANFTSVTEAASGTPYSLTFSGDGNYIVCAIGRNAANTWQPTPTASSLLTLDTTPPTINAISLGVSPSNSSATRSIQFTGTGVVQYKAISYTSGSCDTTALGSATATSISTLFSLPIISDGSYKICAIGKDAAGNWQSSPTISSTLTIDTIAPILAYTSPTSGSSFGTGATVQGTCETGLTITLAGTGISSSTTTSCSSGTFSQAITFSSGDGSKTITASQTDAAGNIGSTSISLIKDSTAPTVTFTSPTASTPSQTTATVQGTCETGLALTISGSGITSTYNPTCSSGGFTQIVTFTAGDGNKTITASQTDSAGNTGNANLILVKDTTAPAIAITSPAANASSQTSATIAGTCETGLTVTFSGDVASSSTTTCSGGSFSASVSFSSGDGSKVINASQTDAAGNIGTASVTLVKDTTAPTLAITSPTANSAAQTGVTIAGTCETGLTVTFAGSGLAGSTTTTCGAGSFSKAVTFSSGDGTKTVTASQTDAAGNTGTVTTTFVKDTVAPVIAITGPAVNTNAKTGVTLTGTCETGLLVSLSGTGLGSPASTTCTSGAFSQAILFTGADGTKNIVVTQSDAAGNIGTDNRDFVQDSTVPTLTITSPAVDTPAKTGVTIAGACETGLSIVLSGTGLASPTSATCTAGAYSQAVTFTSGDGAKLITLTQTDAAGNTTSVTQEFIKDTTAPILTFNTGSQTQSSNTNAAAFSGTCEAGLTITATLSSTTDGTTTCASDGTWSYSSASQTSDGTYSYTFTETDGAGNTTTATGTWTRDATPPALTLVQPSSAMVLAGGSSLSIQWTTSDTHLATIPIEIDYSANGGTTWSIIAPALTNSGTYSWTLPNINSTSVQVRVISSDSFGNSTTATSPSFTIDSSPPVVTLTSLTGGQLLKGGSTKAITWTATDSNLATTPITLSYSADGGTTWTQIATGLSNSGSYTWTVPSTSGTNYFVKVVAADTAGHTAQAVSTSAFAVDATAPTLTNVTLNGKTSGVVVASTSTVTVGWTAADLNFGSYPIAIYYSANGGSTWTLASATSLANSPSTYDWNLSSLGLADGSTYQVKVVATDSVGNQTSVATSNFSVLSSAPALNFASGTNTNSFTSGNTVTYTGSCTNGYSVTITGTDGTNTSVSCTSGAWSWTTPTDSSQGAITYTFSQNNGAFTSTISATWTRDTIAPTISSVVLDGGASTTSLGNLSVAVTMGTEANTSGLKVQLQLANITTQACPSVGTNWQSFPSSGTGTFSYNVTAPPGTKTICVWLQDAAGNTSSVASSSINFQNGNPPSITSFAVTNGVTGSTNYGTTAYSVNDTVNISWTVTDVEGLAANPIYLDYTTDGSTWTPIVSGYGGLSGTVTTYTSTFSGFSAPAGFFEIRIRVTDNSGNWAIPLVSTPQNAAPWTVFAGSTDRGVGSGATTASLASSLYIGSNVAINPNNGDIYAIDSGNAVVKIPSSTGIVSTYIKHSATTNNLSAGGGTITSSTTVISSVTGLVFDGGYLYMLTSTGSSTVSSQIWKIDPTNDTYTLYLGGGTDISTSATSTTAFVMYDQFRFDESHSLYYFTSCASPVTSYTSASTVRMMKVTQTTNGTAGTISAVAGNCVNGTPVSGTAATSTPIGDGINIGLTSFTVWNNGNNIYFRLHGQATNYKIINGTLYSTALPTFNSAQGLDYNPANGLLYVSNNSVSAYNPTTSANGETIASTYVNSTGTGTNCANDNISASTAGCSIVYRLVRAGSQLYVLDGAIGGSHNYRVRYIDGNGKIWTLAGSMPFYGIGLNPLYSRGSYRGVYYKSATSANSGSLTAFPAGLYFTDPSAGVFGYINNNTITDFWGNQSSLCASNSYTTGFQISAGTTYGCGYSTFNFANLSFVFDADGYPWLRPTWAGLVRVDSNLYPNQLTSSTDTGFDTNNWMYANPASQTPSNISYYISNLSNTTFKQTTTRKGFFALNAYYTGSWTSPGPVLRYFDFTSNTIIHIMGSAATAASSSDTTGDLTTLTFSSACQYPATTSGCFTRFVEGDATTETDDILYFSEGTKIRAITNPLNPGSQTLTTILTESANISNFILTTDNTRIYYVMGGYLYCYALSKDYETADCRNRKADVTVLTSVNGHNHGPLGPPTGMTTLTTRAASDNMTWSDSKTLLIANGPQIYQYNVPQPTQTTQNMIWGVNLTGVPTHAKIDAQFQILQQRNIKAIRTGGTPDSSHATTLQYLISEAATYGVKINNIIDVSWLVCPYNPSDLTAGAVKFASNDYTTNYNIGYNNTYNYVLQFKDQVTDWELGNEIDIKSGQSSSPGGYNYGWNASDWQNVSFGGSTDYYGQWAATIKGQADAIAAINAQYGTHLRRVINVVFNHIGWLKFLQAQGVNFEVISYHIYPTKGTSMYSLSSLTPPGAGVNYWNLYAGLGSFNLPVIIDETHCGEIYNGSWLDSASDTLYANCMAGMRITLNSFRHNTQMNLEAVYAYEMYNENSKSAPENHFGLFWSSDTSYTTETPKPMLYLFTEFSGGSVSAPEISTLNSFGSLPLPTW